MLEPEELVRLAVPLQGGELTLSQPREAADLPDSGAVEWAPLAPYWAVGWRSGMALAEHLSGRDFHGEELVELGCGLGAPSIAAARAGGEVLATDSEEDALELLAANAEANGVEVETMRVDWNEPDRLLARAPFDVALVSDCLYEKESVLPLYDLVPVLAPEVWIATPEREPAEAFLGQAGPRVVETLERGVVKLVRLDFS